MLDKAFKSKNIKNLALLKTMEYTIGSKNQANIVYKLNKALHSLN